MKVTKMVALFSVLLTGVSVHAADDVVIESGDTAALVDALAKIRSSGSYRNVLLKPGVYNLKDVAMTQKSTLVMDKGGHAIYGLGEGPEDVILLGGGQSSGRRVLALQGENYSYATISNVTITGGYSAEDGGGINGNGTTRIYNCIISNNCAKGTNAGGGGGVYRAHVERTLFANNRTVNDTAHGGGLWCDKEHGLMNTTSWQGAWDCVFSNNYSAADGGGSYGVYDDGTGIVGGTFVNCKYHGNSANRGGGARRGRLIGCEFTDNVARTGDGGGAHNAVCATNCIFNGNVSTYEFGGGLFTNDDYPVVGCTFEGNHSSKSGGAIYCSKGLISNCTFRCNYNVNMGHGGALAAASPDATFRVVDCRFAGNRSAHGGGAVYAPGGFTSCQFITNSCAEKGGAVYCEGRFAHGDFNGCDFEGNYAKGYGGAIYSSSAANATAVRDCIFSCNSNSSWCTVAGLVDFHDCVITGHVASSYMLLNCNLFRCHVLGNVSTYSAGGVSLDHVSAELSDRSYTNVNCIFKGNVTAFNGVSQGKAVLNCDYLENTCKGGNWGYIIGSGDAVYNTVFYNNCIGEGTRRDFRSGTCPYMTNCTYSAAGSDPMQTGKCAGVFQATDLRFQLGKKPTSPYEPRRSSPLRDAAFDADWIRSVAGAKDVYGHPRVMLGGLDIGAAECQDPAPGMAVLLR